MFLHFSETENETVEISCQLKLSVELIEFASSLAIGKGPATYGCSQHTQKAHKDTKSVSL
jgi:hypothetical protein